MVRGMERDGDGDGESRVSEREFLIASLISAGVY
jgi:hypothetical protein